MTGLYLCMVAFSPSLSWSWVCWIAGRRLYCFSVLFDVFIDSQLLLWCCSQLHIETPIGLRITSCDHSCYPCCTLKMNTCKSDWLSRLACQLPIFNHWSRFKCLYGNSWIPFVLGVELLYNLSFCYVDFFFFF